MEPEPSTPANEGPPAPADAPAPAPAQPQNASGMFDMFVAIPVLSRMLWFLIGAGVATAVTVAVQRGPNTNSVTSANARPLPFEGLPFADNAGVCQEYVALAQLATSHGDALATAERLATRLPTTLRPDNLRVVRAFAPGDQWTIAVDTQDGAGDMEHARAVAQMLNTVPGLNLSFQPVHYTSRRLYESAHVLCMPRSTTEAP